MDDVTLAPGITLVDIVDHLPTVAGRRYRKRPLGGVDKIVTHHSGALGRSGLEGVENAAAFIVRSRPELIRLPYTVWIPWEPEAGKPAVYLCNRLEDWASHSGPKANRSGVAVCLQGCFPTSNELDADPRKFGALEARERPSEFQRRAWPLVIDWLHRTLGRDLTLLGHRDVGKKHTCPGSEPYHWVRSWLETR